jgi:hypothetical protein
VKRYKPDGDMALLRPLSKYFLLDPRELTHIQKVEMLYIHKCLTKWLVTTDMQEIIGGIDRLRIFLKIRGRRRSLYYVFYHCQARHMKEVGYDTKTLRPPTYTPEYHS